ncbi:MAG TPA: pimeloyl-CoA dehydrogenase large subunit, partial [Novosphingobium sp.]
ELRQAASELLLAVAGPAALEVRHDDAAFGDDGAEWLGTVMPNYGILRAASIYGGSSEVQKGILAKSQLGL